LLELGVFFVPLLAIPLLPAVWVRMSLSRARDGTLFDVSGRVRSLNSCH
jgi:hypothetical protein